jgi:pyruvate dehydrogenase E2 component (dihydrolipoamide acetyltransferase)
MPEVPLIMPKLSMTMSEGEVIGWRKQAGEPVSAGEVVCEVLTDKVDMEVEAPVDGVLDRIVAAASTTVPVGAPMAFIRTAVEDLLAGLVDPPASPTKPAGSAPDSTVSDAAAASDGAAAELPTPPSRRGPKPALPGARRRAGELGVRLDGLAGTGPAGAITLADVEQAAAAAQNPPATAAAPPATSEERSAVSPPAAHAGQPAAPGDEPAAELDPGFADALAARRRSVRAAVARVMTASAAVPQFTVFGTLDLAALAVARAGLGWTALLVRAFATVLREHAELNATWSDTGPRPHQHVGVALAVDTPVGLLAPVLTDPDHRPLDELDSAVRRSAERARSGRLQPADLDGATTTVSNLGGFGVDAFSALLTPPQATVLSLGRIGPRPAVLAGGGLTARIGCTVGLTVDHRAADGADAARLLAELADLTASPARLLG